MKKMKKMKSSEYQYTNHRLCYSKHVFRPWEIQATLQIQFIILSLRHSISGITRFPELVHCLIYLLIVILQEVDLQIF